MGCIYMLKKIIILISIIFLLTTGGISYYFLKENKEIINHQKESNDNIAKDNESLELKLKKLIITENEEYTVNSFVSSCIDNISKKCKLKFENSEMRNYKDEGIYKIVIIAQDGNENETKQKTILKIIKNEEIIVNNEIGEENNKETNYKEKNAEKEFNNEKDEKNESVVNQSKPT